MMAGFTFNVKTNKFPGAPSAMRRAIGKAFAVAGPDILQTMKAATPVDTGELRDSETVEVTDEKMTFRATAGHALFVHEGVKNRGPQPFMRESVEQGIPLIESEIAKAAQHELA